MSDSPKTQTRTCGNCLVESEVVVDEDTSGGYLYEEWECPECGWLHEVLVGEAEPKDHREDPEYWRD